MGAFVRLLRTNPNYRYAWFGQIVSEIGDHFNTIAVFSLVLERTGSGLVVSAVMLARAVPMILAGPIAGVALDRFNRKKLMIASDVVRGVLGALFIACLAYEPLWPIYALSGLMMFASPFFTSGRTAILPAIASDAELHTANSLTQTTKAITVTAGTLLGGVSVAALGYEAAFLINAASFLFSGWMVALLQAPKNRSFHPRRALTEQDVARPWHEYREGLSYMRRRPLVLGIGLLGVGWAFGGGAAQILFSLFGDQVFGLGATGIGAVWSAAGAGLLVGATIGHWAGEKIRYEGYKTLIGVCYLFHGLTYIAFSQAGEFWLALVLVGLSRAGMGISMTLNQSQLLRHVADAYRGRVYSTIETMVWATMMISLTAAGVASETMSPRTIGAAAGSCAVVAGAVWLWANASGRLPPPAEPEYDPADVEMRSRLRV